VPAGALERLATDERLRTLSSDQSVRAHMAVTNASIGADLVHEGLAGGPALTGANVAVAVLDSGVASVPELRGKIVANVDFTDDPTNGQDRFGHGTHVAGIVAANGRTYDAVGVAPGALIVNVKVLASTGAGNASDVSPSWRIRRMRWTSRVGRRRGMIAASSLSNSIRP